MVCTIRRMEAEVDNFHTACSANRQWRLDAWVSSGFLNFTFHGFLKDKLHRSETKFKHKIFPRLGLLEYTRVIVTDSVMPTFPDSSDIRGFAVVMLANKSLASVCLLVTWSNIWMVVMFGGELSQQFGKYKDDR